jgi:hypothetical protein
VKEFIIPGIVSTVAGILMTMFNQAIGVGFCKMGKASWDSAKDSPNDFVRGMARGSDAYYDEKSAPRIIRLLGVVFVIQGLLLIAVGLFR